jgi:hypothetical protein
MNKKGKSVLIISLILITLGAIITYMVWNKPRRKVENEKGIAVSAAQIVSEYQQNEAEANKKYLDKAIQVTGNISEIKNNQDGKPTIMLTSDDPFAGVFCTLKKASGNIKTGSVVTIKGICSGMLSDVRLREAVVIQ